jgi:hypothetical protein
VGVLSGDVHYSYLARGQSPAGATVWQVVCSPLRNPLGALFRYVNVIAFWRPIGGLGRFLARRADVRQPDLRWDIVQGPWFDNALATVTLDGALRRGRLAQVGGRRRGDRAGAALRGDAGLAIAPGTAVAEVRTRRG